MNLFERALGMDAVADAFCDEAIVASMARFEVELARAQASIGLIPATAAESISHCVPAFEPDIAAMAAQAAHAGTLAVPFIAALRTHVAKHDTQAAEYLHFGTTTQDVIDTALVLCTRSALDTLLATISDCVRVSRALAIEHRATPMLARTLLQAAGITSVGFKVAQWSLALHEGRQRLQHTSASALALSLGGAIGNLSAFGEHAQRLRTTLARNLGLADPGITWHTLRHRWMALASDAALLCGSMAKIAQDIALLAQNEVSELHEPVAEGRGVSSAMPHKRNPVLCMRVLAATQPVPGMLASLLAAMPQAHERGLGDWQAELTQWPGLFQHAQMAAGALQPLLGGLRVDGLRCRENIQALRGTIFAEPVTGLLAPALGRQAATQIVKSLCQRAISARGDLRHDIEDLLRTDSRLHALSMDQVAGCFDVDTAARASAFQVTDLVARIPD